MTAELKGKNAIITGCARGIGHCLVEQFAKSGCNVWAFVRKETDELQEEFKCLADENNVWIKLIALDLTDEKQMKRTIQDIMKEKLPIDILINNAGIAYGGTLHMTSISKLKEVFDVNYFAQIQLIQLVSRIMMKQKKGSIVNMASVGGIETNPGYLAYGSSKAALIWATKTISKELGVYNIRVNAVAPGLTDTSMGHYKSDEEYEKVVNRTSLKRIAQPEEIANAVIYLASDDALFVTGHVLVVDGGRI